MAREPLAPIRDRLAREVGRLDKRADTTVGLVYPSPYRAGMSSLGFQQIYKLIQQADGFACERAFLPDSADRAEVAAVSYEGLRPLRDFPILAFSVAYELELAGLVQLLEAAQIPSLRRERGEAHPFVLAGGPLTFSNPLPLAAFADAILIGEAEELIVPVLEIVRDAGSTKGIKLNGRAVNSAGLRAGDVVEVVIAGKRRTFDVVRVS